MDTISTEGEEMSDGGSEINCWSESSEFQFACSRELVTQVQYFRERAERDKCVSHSLDDSCLYFL